MYDLLIKNGKYPDFEKGEFVSADIAVKDGKIAAILPESAGDAQAVDDAARTIDASGRVVSPGFELCHQAFKDRGDESDRGSHYKR